MLFPQSITLPLFLSIIRSTASPIIHIRTIVCSPVHILVARASTEDPGTGIIGSLATLIQNSHPKNIVTIEAIDYPATLEDYQESSANGTAALISQLTDYVQACPCSEIVLLGYSQGAHVVGDALCGGGGVLGNAITTAVDDNIGDKVVAAIQMGDPRFVANLTYDRGNATKDGIFPRPISLSCGRYAEKIQSYCDANDPYCASGNDSEVHLTYTNRYNDDALAFVNEKLV